MVSQHHPDFLYMWRQASFEKQAGELQVYGANRSRATRKEIASEAEALRLWLADGGDLSDASLYGLEIIVGDDMIDQRYERERQTMVNQG